MLTSHRIWRRPGCLLALVGTFFLSEALCPKAQAQQEATGPPEPAEAKPPPLTAEDVQARLKQTEEAKEIDAALKKKLIDAYRDTLTQLKTAEDWARKAVEFQQAMNAAPQLLAEIKAELANPQAEPRVAPPDDASITQLEQLLAKEEAELGAVRKAADELEGQAKQRSARRIGVPKLLAATRQRLDDIKQQLTAAAAPTDAVQLAQARQAQFTARQMAVEAEIAAYEKEILSYDARGGLLTTKTDLAVRRVAERQKRADAWRELVDKQRRAEAERAARKAQDARREAARAHPKVQALAEENERLANLRTGGTGLAARIRAAAAELQVISEKLNRLKEGRRSVEQRIEVTGLTRALAVLLRRQREDLPDVPQHWSKIRKRHEEIADAQLQLFEAQERRSALNDIDAQVEACLRDLPPQVAADQREDIKTAARELLGTQRSLIEALIADYQAYVPKLSDLDASERQLVAEAEDYRKCIGRRIMWTQSAAPLKLSDLDEAWNALCWMASPSGWGSTLPGLARDLRTDSALYAVVLLVVMLLLTGKRRIKRRLQALADDVTEVEKDRLGHTFDASVLTTLLTVPWPLLVWFLGWRLRVTPGATDLGGALGAGLHTMAGFWLVYAILRYVCLPQGLGPAHFQWRGETADHVRKQIWWLMVAALPLVFVISALEAQDSPGRKETLGRFAFIALMVVLSAFAHSILKPSGATMRNVIRRRSGGWLDRSRYVWYGLAVAMPLAWAVLAALGYHYAAQELGRRARLTLLLLLALGLLHEMAIRGLHLVRRRLALRRLEQRRVEVLAAESEEEGEEEPHEAPPDDELDMHAIYTMGVQARQFVRGVLGLALLLGLWLIWIDVLPALGVLREVELWPTTVTETQKEQRAEGGPVLTAREKVVYVTLADVGLALVTVLVTVIAVKNIPGLLEMLVLHRLPMGHGVRFAITTILRYVLTVIGTILAFGAIGIGWGHVQWLIAAMTVGLGFGLQEIFANFVSGLIILFERPIRVGDTVTVGDTIGTVTQIRIRATTITDWDRKELVVPNKEFITDRLVNWTLSDPIIRRSFPVGIAYGSDTALATRTLLQVAQDEPLVLDDPESDVVFTEFGDSALVFELRVFVRGIQDYLEVWGKLNTAIDNAFREADIEIAFPQRDLHVRSIRAELPVMGKQG